MSDIQLVLLIILCIFLGLSLISLIFFNVIFLLKRHYLNQSYRLNSRFNTLNNTSKNFNIKSIETLILRNSNLMPILTFLKDFHEVYKNQLEIVKTQLYNLAKVLKTFQLVKTHKYIKQIKNNFDLLDKQINEYRNVNLDTQKYSNTCSNISTEMFSIISKITSFNKDMMFQINYPKYRTLKEIDKRIIKVSQDINEEINCVNWESIHKSFLTQLALINSFFNASKQIFEIDKLRLSLNSLYLEINKNIEVYSGYKETKKEYNEIAYNAKSNSDELAKRIVEINYDDLSKSYKKELNNLENLLKKIKTENVFHRIYIQVFDTFKTNLDNFFYIVENHELKNLYSEIKKNFKNNPEIYELVSTNNNLGLSIVKEMEAFNNTLSRPLNSLNYEEAVHSIYNIYALIISFKEHNEKLFKLISAKNEDLLKLIFIINDLTVKLSDINGLLVANKIKDPEIHNQFVERQKVVEELKETAKGNFKMNDKVINSKILSVNNYIENTLELIQQKVEQKLIIKRLAMKANHYRTSKNSKSFAEFDQLHRIGKYDELIDKYIKFIQQNQKQKRVS